MNSTSRQLIEQLHASGRRFVLALSGGGSQAIADLLAVPGGSRSILEAVIPYSAPAMNDWLGGEPDQYCAARTARAMAMAAFERAWRLAPDDDPHTLVGVGCTASLASDRPKRGPHRIHVAWQTSRQTGVDSLELVKGERDRAGEEKCAAALILYSLSQAIGEDANNEFYKCLNELFIGSEYDDVLIVEGSTKWSELLLGKRNVVFENIPNPQAMNLSAHADGVAAKRDASWPRVVFPGAFNPLHNGHRRMAEIAAARTGEPVCYELSIANVDKRPLDFIEIADRLDNLGDMPVVLTRVARFTEKAKLFPGVTFVVGADTMARIADPRYYANDHAKAAEAIQIISAQGCRFVVFGRTTSEQFVGLEDLDLPADLRGLCEGLPESDFREDISSTEKRSESVKRAT